MSSNNDQASQRVYQRYSDQHDREWGASTENKTRAPTGKVEPLFEAPLYPPQKYLRTVPGKPYDLLIDYEAWKNDARAANAQYRRDAMEEGMRQHGSAYDPDAEVSRSVRAVIGLPPFPLDVVIAASQGNPWLIGKDQRPDVRLAKYFVKDTEPDEEDYSTVQYGDAGDSAGDDAPPLDLPSHRGRRPSTPAGV